MNFFVTGNEIFKAGIDLKFITPAGNHGANFSYAGQTLNQSFSIAQEVFDRVAYGKIDFVLIGLSPDTLFRDEKFSADNVEKNLQVLNDYIKLCVDGGAKPVAVLLPYAPSVRESCREKFLTLRDVLTEFQKLYDFAVVDLFELPLADGYFADDFCLNEQGKFFASCALGLKVHEKVLPFENLCEMTYDFFQVISRTFSQKYFNDVMSRVFAATTKKLRHKEKIKVGFSLWDPSMWCGDELYNLFARDPRFEPTLFLYLTSSLVGELRQKDLKRGLAKFKAAGLNVVPVVDGETIIPKQDVLIFLIPYPDWYPLAFQTNVLTAETLVTYIPYSFEISSIDVFKWPVYEIGWKIFCETRFNLRLASNFSLTGGVNFYYSGYPKVDIFSDATKNFSFPWKMTHPDAVKIIWAPHWTVDGLVDTDEWAFSTFHHNFRFMYEFAKNHPETSWVVKPHPRLLISAVDSGLFPSVAAFEDYLQAWNNLPNAQVFTGAYYQEIFATSDGMILDSCSFVAEYQYTHKPMIYLTQEKQCFNAFGKEILSASYLVDGHDLEGIAALLQKVFIDGDDFKKAERQKVFDELLNYRLVNGTSASKFIFKSITQEIGA